MTRALALAAIAAVSLLAGCPTKDRCATPRLECGGSCVDASADRANCGACGNVCATGTDCCGGVCVDVRGTDVRNCGACGQRCPDHGVCTAGACACPDALATRCGASPGACVDVGVDPVNCGTCGERCAGVSVAPANPACSGGTCLCGGTRTSTDCGGNPRCVNLDLDPANCGSCGHACTSHAACTSGACACDPASAFPDNCGTLATPVCVNKTTDAAHCGACGQACGGATPSCVGGRCCAAGQSNCSGACVDTTTNPANCGACGHACAAGQSCTNGSCGCGGSSPLTCGASCCAGSACCGSSCQTTHSNGLGGSFYDCSPTYAPSATTVAAATAAALSWSASGTTYNPPPTQVCQGSCVARQTSTACAVWCYGPSTWAGKVALVTGDTNCTAACLGFIGPVANVTVGTWQ